MLLELFEILGLPELLELFELLELLAFGRLLELLVLFELPELLELLLELLEFLDVGVYPMLGALRKMLPVCKALRSTKYVKKFPFRREFIVELEL